MDAVTVITLFTPFIIWAVIETAKALVPALQGVGTMIAVPVLTIVLTLATHAAGVETNMYLQIVLGLVSLFLDNLLNAIKGTPPTVR
jgi:hypothetical protein